MSREIELAWAAGFFDGEGSISAGVAARNGGAVYLNMSVGQSGDSKTTPPASLERFRDAVGCGTIRYRRKRQNLGTRPMWYWHADGIEDTKQAVRALLPFILEKRDQVAEAMALRHEWEGLFADRKRFCKRGHEFTENNVYTYENRPTPARLCRACNRENTRKSRVSRRAQDSLLAAEGVG